MLLRKDEREMASKTLKKIWSYLLMLCMVLNMVLGSVPMTVSAEDVSQSGREDSSPLEAGKSYAVPLEFYDSHNEEVKGNTASESVQNYIDNVAIVNRQSDGAYQVTLHIDHIDKIDMLQFLKPGEVEEGTVPSDIVLGTYNIPESYICTADAADVITSFLIEKGRISEAWNDRYIQDVTVASAGQGTGYVTFSIDTLSKSLYVGAFRSYNATRASTKYSSLGKGRVTFRTDDAYEIQEIAGENDHTAGSEVSRVSSSTEPNESSVSDETIVNQLISLEKTEVDGGRVRATFRVAEGERKIGVRLLTEIIDLNQETVKVNDTNYKQYADPYPPERTESKPSGLSVYSEELVQEDGSFEVEYSNLYEIVFGKKICISLDGTNAYYGELRIRSGEKREISYTDGDITFVSDTNTVQSDVQFASNPIAENTDEDSEYNKLYSMLASTASKAKIYKPALSINGNSYEPKRNVQLQFQIPEGWNTENVRIYRLKGTADEGSMYDIATSLFDKKGSSYEVDGDVCVLSTAFVGETYALVEEATATNIKALEDGIYKVNTVVWQKENPTFISMADAAVDNSYTYLIVSNNGEKKEVYFDLQGIKIGTSYGYTSRLYLAENELADGAGAVGLGDWHEIEYYSYYTTPDGTLDIDGYAIEFQQYYPRRVGFSLPESANIDNGVYIKFVVPIMDDLSNYVPGSGDGARIALMKFTGAERVAEYSEAAHDKTVLLVAVDKASKYNADDYTEESYQVLVGAVEKAQGIIDGQAATGAQIAALEQEIMAAVSGLQEATGLDRYHKILNRANGLEERDYTAESWADLQAVLDVWAGTVTEETADDASAMLQAAIDALVPLSSAVSLEEGVYEVQASFLNPDGTVSDRNSALKSARSYVDAAGNITVYLYTEGVTGLAYRRGAGYEDAEAEAIRYAVALPANVEQHKVKVATESGVEELLLNLDLKGAQKQQILLSDLNGKLEAAKALNQEDYTEDSYARLAEAIKTAEDVLRDKAAFQTEINIAAAAMDSATEGLVMKEEVQARKDLDQAVSDAKNNYPKANYTQESYAGFEAAIEAAERVLNDPDASALAMRAQIDSLNEALNALVRLDDTVDKTELNGYLESALQKKNDGVYTENSWNSFQAAIASARKASTDVNATREEVDKQTKLLTASYEALVLKNKQSGLFEDYPQIYPGTYSVGVSLLNATADEASMGNASMVQTGTVRVSEKGEVTLELDFQSMQFAGQTGYLYQMKKVDMDTVEYNQYHYPVKYEAKDATILEEYTGVYDLFNDPNSEYYDANTKGSWYPKKLSIPINLNDNLFYVEVYVPVMESIGEGQGTKVARVSIDWANLKQTSGIDRDNGVLEALLSQVSEMTQGTIPDVYWTALNAAYITAQDVYRDMNSTQKEIDLQITALQAAVDVIETQKVDKTDLNALIETALTEAGRTDIIYTSATLEALKTAISNAQTIVNKENATKAEIQAQMTALQTALAGLRAVDKTGLNELIEKAKAEALQTDVYESASLTVLNSAISIAENVAKNALATESEVTAAQNALRAAMLALVKIEKADKSELERKIAEAKGYLSQTDVYTESSLEILLSAVNKAQAVYENDSASQALVDSKVEELATAINALSKKSGQELDIKNLADGIYSVYGTMVKVDKTTYSMSNEAINHTLKLTVKDGKYFITINFNGLTVGQKLGYLSKLRYFTTGYTLDQYGNPQGTLADVTVDSYQKSSDGTLVSDTYGTNYPDEVTFELIPEALEDGYVPLQVFVPIMDAISSGTGTQSVFLKLDWSSLKATTADDPDFNGDDNNENDNNNNTNGNSNNNNNNGGINKNSNLGTGSLGNNTSGTNSLGNGTSSLKSSTSGTGSSLKSASSVKTDDEVQNHTLWAAILLLGGVMLMAGMMEYRKRNKKAAK